MTVAEFVGWVVIVLVVTFSITELTYRLVVWGSLRLGLYRDLWAAVGVVRARRQAGRAVRPSDLPPTCGTCGGPLESDERGTFCSRPLCGSNLEQARAAEEDES